MATARRQSVDPLERLDTPAWVTRALIKHAPDLLQFNIIEPCAGANAIARELIPRLSSGAVAAFDIEPRHPGVLQVDTMTPGFFEQIAVKHDASQIALVTNPPFSLATSYARRGQVFAATALLVRLSWLEAAKGRDDITAPGQIIVVPRPKFTGPGACDPDTGEPYKGGDSVTVCWCVWRRYLAAFNPIVRISRSEKAELEALRALPLEAA